MRSSQQRAFKRANTLSMGAVQPSTGGRPVWLVTAVPLFLVLCAAALWGVSLRYINLHEMTDFGLISVLPISFFVAVIILTVSFCLTLRWRSPSMPVVLVHLVALIFVLSGTVTLLEETLRNPVQWRHLGFVEYITRLGALRHKVDAYFDWPGFFSLAAFVAQIAGFENGLSLAEWSTVFLGLLYIGPLVMIFRSLTDDWRLVWLAVWFFYLTNWVGQDYFSPQGLNYFLFLAILGILLKWFKRPALQSGLFGQRLQRFGLSPRWADRISGWLVAAELPNTPSHPEQRVGLIGIVILLFVVAVFSHMLTPFFILAAVTILVVCKRLDPWGLPVLMTVLIGTWLSFMAVSFLSGHTEMITRGFGEVEANVNANVTERLRGSVDHMLVVRLKLVLTVATWGLAFLGFLRRLQKGYWDLNVVLLAAVPFPLLALLTYGGEMLMRVYLFSLPSVAFFAAALFYTAPALGSSWRTSAGIGLISVLLLAGFPVARYGNERMDSFSVQEVDAVHRLYNIAKPGSLIVAAVWNVPWRFRDYEQYRYAALTDEALSGDVDAIAHFMKNKRYTGTYLILTRAQKAYVELFVGAPPGTWERFERAVTESREFRLVFANEDAKIFVLVNGANGTAP